jgi:hypothetical protein
MSYEPSLRNLVIFKYLILFLKKALKANDRIIASDASNEQVM